jgi:hypothetical protein
VLLARAGSLEVVEEDRFDVEDQFDLVADDDAAARDLVLQVVIVGAPPLSLRPASDRHILSETRRRRSNHVTTPHPAARDSCLVNESRGSLRRWRRSTPPSTTFAVRRPAGVEYGDYECPYSRQAYRAIGQVERRLGASSASPSGASR